MLRVNNLTGFGVGGKAEDPSITFVSSASNTNSDSYSASMDIGDAARGLVKHVIVALSGADGNDTADDTFTVSGTVDGVSLTQAVEETFSTTGPSFSSNFSWIGIAAVSSAGSKTVALTLTGFGGTMDDWTIAVYRAVGLSSATATATGQNNGTGASVTMDVPANGFGVVTASSKRGDGNIDITNLVDDVQGQGGAVGHKTTAGSASHTDADCRTIVYATWTFQ